MKWIISFLVLLLSFNSFAQKHVEIISELQDSMILINKQDADSINKAFYDRSVLDSLNTINEKLIDSLIVKNEVLDSILVEQRAIIVNDSILRSQVQIEFDNKIKYYEKEIKRQSSKKIFYQSTTGIGILTIILILLI